MSLKTPLEKPILEAIIRYAYALRADEEAALLSAFLVISYHVHREAVACLQARSPSGYDDEQLISATLQTPEPLEMPPEISSPGAPASDAAASADAAISAMVDADAVPLAMVGSRGDRSFLARRINATAGKLVQTLKSKLRSRESVLQEEEELALFHTIEGVADQVNREAIEQEIWQGLGGDRFASAREWVSEDIIKVKAKPAREGMVRREFKRGVLGLAPEVMGTYIEAMDEELTITRGIIDRNRAVSQEYRQANAV